MQGAVEPGESFPLTPLELDVVDLGQNLVQQRNDGV